MISKSPPPIVPSDKPSIFAILQNLRLANPPYYQAVVRPNNPPLGIGGFLFDIPGDEEVRLRSQITDYFLEDNTTVQDNIAIEPETITLRGMIAELTYKLQPPGAQSKTPANALPLLPDMQPPLTATQQANYNASQPSTTAIQVDSIYRFYEALGGIAPQQSLQADAFNYFYNLWTGRQLLSVETPWGIWQDVAILDLRINQAANTRYESDFTVVFKKMRFAGTIVVQEGQLAGRNALQAQPQTQDGNAGQGTITDSQRTQALSIFDNDGD